MPKHIGKVHMDAVPPHLLNGGGFAAFMRQHNTNVHQSTQPDTEVPNAVPNILSNNRTIWSPAIGRAMVSSVIDPRSTPFKNNPSMSLQLFNQTGLYHIKRNTMRPDIALRATRPWQTTDVHSVISTLPRDLNEIEQLQLLVMREPINVAVSGLKLKYRDNGTYKRQICLEMELGQTPNCPPAQDDFSILKPERSLIAGSLLFNPDDLPEQGFNIPLGIVTVDDTVVVNHLNSKVRAWGYNFRGQQVTLAPVAELPPLLAA